MGSHTFENYERGRAIATVAANFDEQGFGDSVILMAGITDNVASVVAGDTIDFIYIAADHRYSQIKKDIENWWPKVRAGGIMCGIGYEDSYSSHRTPGDPKTFLPESSVIIHCEEDNVGGHHLGVIRAVGESFGEAESEAGIWWVRKK